MESEYFYEEIIIGGRYKSFLFSFFNKEVLE